MKERIKSKFEIKEILKFLVGGGSAVIVDGLLYMFLKQYMNLSGAKAISYVTGAVVGFIINKLWTFESKKFKVMEVYKYIILYVCSAFVNTVINRLILYMFSSTVFAFLCATGSSTVINFLGQKFFVFKRGEKK